MICSTVFQKDVRYALKCLEFLGVRKYFPDDHVFAVEADVIFCTLGRVKASSYPHWFVTQLVPFKCFMKLKRFLQKAQLECWPQKLEDVLPACKPQPEACHDKDLDESVDSRNSFPWWSMMSCILTSCDSSISSHSEILFDAVKLCW